MQQGAAEEQQQLCHVENRSGGLTPIQAVALHTPPGLSLGGPRCSKGPTGVTWCESSSHLSSTGQQASSPGRISGAFTQPLEGCTGAQLGDSTSLEAVARVTSSSKRGAAAMPRSSLLNTPCSTASKAATGKALSQPSGCTAGDITKYSVGNVLQELEIMFRWVA